LKIESVAARQLLLNSGKFWAVIHRWVAMLGDRQNGPEENQ
jgi:hypothetical protein